MQTKRHANLVNIKLDADDLMQLISRVTNRVMESDSVLIKMHDWETHRSYSNYLEVLKELGLMEYEVPLTIEMATQFSDELVTALFADGSIAEVYQLPEHQKENHLKMARICVVCHKGYVADTKGHTCDA